MSKASSSRVPALRLGVVDYLNARPLWYALRGNPRFELVPAIPSQLAFMLKSGEIQAGLLPVIEYFRNPGVRLVAGCGVASRGPVSSVKVFLRVPVKDIRRVRLDAASRTSQALARIVLKARFRLEPEFIEQAVEPAELSTMAEDAALVIGDPCMKANALHPRMPALDLGEEWKRITGLPFVYAGWLVRPGLDTAQGRELAQHLRAASEQGMGLVGEIARESAAQGFKPADVERYLRQNIHYHIGEPELAGLVDFGRRAAHMDLCGFRELDVIS